MKRHPNFLHFLSFHTVGGASRQVVIKGVAFGQRRLISGIGRGMSYPVVTLKR